MLFTKYYYIFIFLPFVFLLYFYLNKKNNKQAKAFLILASLYFYGFWNVKYLALIFLSIGFNYSFGICLKQDKSHIPKKLMLIFAIFQKKMEI